VFKKLRFHMIDNTMTSHNQKGIDICNSLKAKTDLLTMFYNQLLGVGD